MIRRHFIKPGPGASRIDSSLSEYRNPRSCVRQNLFHEGFVEFSFEARGLFRIVPGQQNAFTFAAKMKSGGHVDDHREALRQSIERFRRYQLAPQWLNRKIGP